jgi:lactate racemase
MRGSVEFQDEQLELELPDELLVGLWKGPAGVAGAAAVAAIRNILEHPLDFPPVRQAVVPGDRVAIALDSSLGEVGPVLSVLVDLLCQSGVDRGDVTVVASPGAGASLPEHVPRGVAFELHYPEDQSRLAYLATTKEGRRIYLNRHVTDADVVIPVGRLGYDPILGYRGPWGTIFPGLSDQQTRASYRQKLADDTPEQLIPRPEFDEAFEVSWLLGTQFHLGLLPGRSGLAEAWGGLADRVRDSAIGAIDRLWSFRPPTRAECVVAGIGSPHVPTGIDELVEGLVTASRLVTHGGKIVALSRTQGIIGPSLQRLTEAGDPKNALAALRGHDADPDSVAGRRLARVLSWADVYLYSGIDRQTVEDLSMVPIDHLDDARRLLARSSSCILLSHADLTRGTVVEEELR